MSVAEIDYLCVGVCMEDPESGYCLGCGRPPLATPNSGPDHGVGGTIRDLVATGFTLDVPDIAERRRSPEKTT